MMILGIHRSEALVLGAAEVTKRLTKMVSLSHQGAQSFCLLTEVQNRSFGSPRKRDFSMDIVIFVAGDDSARPSAFCIFPDSSSENGWIQ